MASGSLVRVLFEQCPGQFLLIFSMIQDIVQQAVLFLGRATGAAVTTAAAPVSRLWPLIDKVRDIKDRQFQSYLKAGMGLLETFSLWFSCRR